MVSHFASTEALSASVDPSHLDVVQGPSAFIPAERETDQNLINTPSPSAVLMVDPTILALQRELRDGSTSVEDMIELPPLTLGPTALSTKSMGLEYTTADGDRPHIMVSNRNDEGGPDTDAFDPSGSGVRDARRRYVRERCSPAFDDTFLARSGHSTPEQLSSQSFCTTVYHQDDLYEFDNDGFLLPETLTEAEASWLLEYLESNRYIFGKEYERAVEDGRDNVLIYLPGGVVIQPLAANGAAQVVEILPEDHPQFVSLDVNLYGLESFSRSLEEDAQTDDGYHASGDSTTEDDASSENDGRIWHCDRLHNSSSPSRCTEGHHRLTSNDRSSEVEAQGYDRERDIYAAPTASRIELRHDSQTLNRHDDAHVKPTRSTASAISRSDEEQIKQHQQPPQVSESNARYRLPPHLQRLKEDLASRGVSSNHIDDDLYDDQPSHAQVKTESVPSQGALVYVHGDVAQPSFGEAGEQNAFTNRGQSRQLSKATAFDKPRLRIPSNRPRLNRPVITMVSTEVAAAGCATSTGAAGHRETISIDEEAPLRRYAGAEHSKLPRTQVARSLRSRQIGVRLPQREEQDYLPRFVQVRQVEWFLLSPEWEAGAEQEQEQDEEQQGDSRIISRNEASITEFIEVESSVADEQDEAQQDGIGV